MSASDQKIAYHLSFSDVIRVLRLVDASPFREMQLEVGDLKLRVMREHAGATHVQPTQSETAPFNGTPEGTSESRTDPVSSMPPPVTRAVSHGTPVVAPLAGTFYHSPYPGQPSFVEVGSVVDKGDVLGILEIMKLMNNVLAPCSGVVREICAANEEFVEFGQVLAVIEPGSGSR